MPEPIPATEKPAAEQEPAPAPAETPGDGKPDPWEGLPETHAWVKESHAQANREAANYRTQLREAQEKYKDAKTPEEFAEITSALEHKNNILDAARKYKVSDDDLEFLTGKTPEDLARQAEKLAKRAAAAAVEPVTPPVVVTKVPLAGGVQPGDGVAPRSGTKLWADYKKTRR